MTTSYFQETGSNYIGTPEGVLHTNKPSSEVTIHDFLGDSDEGPIESFRYHYKVSCCDTLVMLNLGSNACGSEIASKPISFVFNSQWLGLND